MNIAYSSDIGNQREINQDYVNIKKLNEDQALCVLCDGMGGHKAGEVASEMVGKYLLENFPQSPVEEHQIYHIFSTLFQYANHSVYKESMLHEEYEGMGTTAIIVYIDHKNIYLSHVGDSRAYMIKDNHLKQLTQDDTFVNELVKSGLITKEEALTHPQRNVLIQAVGASDSLEISYHKAILDETLLLCSDGLYNSLEDHQIIEIMNQNLTLQEKANKLIDQAKLYGGYDNITVLIAEKGDKQ